MRKSIWTVVLAVVLIVGLAVRPAQALPRQPDLTELTLEQLMNIEITTVSKKEELLFTAPAAAYVITGEQIRRSGVRSIPEALRMAPGVEVAQIDGNKWAISIRGFNSRFANKLLVLIDGRSVYTPLFAGVFWDVQDTLLEDIDRIEVIRGPGGTLWGANAVNGVINIITKKASVTQGWYAEGGGGNEEHGFAGLRYGGTFGAGGSFRGYGTYFKRDSFVTPTGQGARDDLEAFRGGFRMDWGASTRDDLTVQGDIYRGDYRQTSTIPALAPPFAETFKSTNDFTGGNLLARWRHRLADRSETNLQLYYDRTERGDALVREDLDTIDLDFQHRWAALGSHDIVWGVGGRAMIEDVVGRRSVSFRVKTRTLYRASGFIQDEIALIKDRLSLTLGSKFEQATFSGFEVQPSARLFWSPRDRHAVWAAVSRAVRTPSRAEVDARSNVVAIPPSPGDPSAAPAFIVATGTSAFKPEELIASELGYRVEPVDWLLVDVAAFYNIYNNLRTGEPGTRSNSIVPSVFGNKASANTYGVEVATTWRPVGFWRLQVNYTYLKIRVHPDLTLTNPSFQAEAKADEDRSPHHQVQAISHLDLPWRLQFDAAAYFVDRVPSFNVPSYLRLDLRLGWRPTEAFELSLVGQNLLDNAHREFGSILGDALNPTEVQRSVFAKATWRF